MTTESMTPADLAAVCGNNNNSGWGFGGDGAWWIIILLLFGWGRNGFGYGGMGGGCGSPCATQADLAAGFNNSAVLSGINGIDSALCQGFNGINTAILQSGYNTQAGFNALSAQLAQCCCDNRAAIADVKFTIANESCDTRHAIYNSSRDIIDNANANSRAILDFLTQDKIATLTAENQALKFQASQTAQNAFITANQEAQTAELIRRLDPRPCPQPAYVVQPPQPVTFPTNCCGTANYAAGGCGGF